MEIKWLKTALRNLDEEAAYIAREDPRVARLVVRRIHEAVASLRNNPSLGRPGRVPGTRELVVPKTRYIIPDRVRPRLLRIEILRVFHVSRKPPKRW